MMMEEGSTALALDSGQEEQSYRLTPAQQIWAAAPDAEIGLTLCFDAPVDPVVLRRALAATGDAFEALRARFPAGQGLSVQTIDLHQPAWLTDDALTAVNGPVASAMLDESGTVLRLRALALTLDRGGMLLWAKAIGLACRGVAVADTVQPADAAEGLAALAEEEAARTATDFWRQAMAGGEPAGRLPEEAASGGGLRAVHRRGWGGAVPTAAQALALWQHWIAREADLARVTIGVELSGRDEDLADAVGNYARDLPCTLAVERDASLERAAAVAAAWLDQAAAWMLVAPPPSGPATDRVGELHGFAYGFGDRRGDPAIDWPGSTLKLNSVGLPCRLSLSVHEEAFAIGYDTASFSDAAAAALADRFAGFVAAALADPARKLADVPRLTPAMATAILARGIGPMLASGPAATVLDLIAAAVAEQPDAIALSDAGGDKSYAAFWDEAGRIAARLTTLGVARVALVAPRCAATIVALIGILRAGAVAVPVDPDYPAARQAALIADVEADLILADMADRCGELACPVLTIADALQTPRAAVTLPQPTGNDGAYIIHTSGSTGRPKGVLVSHANLLASTAARFDYYADRPRAFLLTPSLSFDSSVAGLYWTLASGGCLVLPAPGDERDPAALARLIAQAGVSHWLTVPALCQTVLTAAQPGELDTLSDVIVAGEACPASLIPAHATATGARLHNEYGPTEATVWCTAWSWHPGDPLPDAVPIGRPIAGAAIYLLDDRGAPVPDGAVGQIHVGGAGVATGYVDQPEATALAFTIDRFGKTPGARLYATGDLARRQADGTILYLGRADRQLKLAGRRIEPGEIESRLDAFAGVERSVVLIRDGRLVGYVQHATGAAPDVARIRTDLAASLPPWLVPTAITALERFPAGPNGKLDLDALPDPDQALRPAYRAPTTPAALALAEAIASVVGVRDVGLDDHFFALGGDSLMALQVAAQLRRDGFALSVRSIFATPVLAALVEDIVPVGGISTGAGDDEAPAPLNPIQRWFVARDLPDAAHYNQAVAFEVTGGLSLDRLETALTRVVAHHPALRSLVERDGDGWHQRPLTDATVTPGWFDLRALPAAVKDRVFAQRVAELQRGLDPARGVMIRAAGFRMAADKPDLLAIVAHHLAIDALSWHVLAEDLAAAWHDRALTPALGFGAWARALADQPAAPEWSTYLAAADGQLPRDHAGDNLEQDAIELTLVLPASQARALSRWAGGRAGRSQSDAVLAALAIVLGDWAGHHRLLIDVEGSGRDVPADLPDPSRTIGWLTTLAPLVLPHHPTDARERRLQQAIEALATAPADWRFGLDAAAGTASGAEFCVNFLGGMGGDTVIGDLLRPVPVDLGPPRGGSNPRGHLIDLEIETGAAGMTLIWRYPGAIYDAETIRALAVRHLALLAELADDAA